MKEDIENIKKLFDILGDKTQKLKSISISYELIIEGCVKPKIVIEFNTNE